MKIERISTCNMCGMCCKAIILYNMTEEKWDNYKMKVEDGTWDRDSELKFLIDNWVLIDKEEAFKRNPQLREFKNGMEEVIFFKCNQLDEKTNKCKVHKDRPDVCIKYPFYRLKETILPNNFDFYNLECGYSIFRKTEKMNGEALIAPMDIIEAEYEEKHYNKKLITDEFKISTQSSEVREESRTRTRPCHS